MRLHEVANYANDKIEISSIDIHAYISTDNMLTNRAGIIQCESVPQMNKVTRYLKNDVLVSNIRPYFKKIWYANKNGGCSNDVLVFRTTHETRDSSHFLYYVLSQDCFFDYMMSGANGTKMPRGNKRTIPDFQVPNFSIEKQHRIADILSAYDDLIENNQKQIKLLEEAAQRLYKEWFVDLRFPGYENTEIVDGVPEGWLKCEIGKLIGKVARSKQIKTADYCKEGSIPIVDQSQDFIAGYTDDIEAKVDLLTPVIVFGDHTRILKLIQFPFAKGADGTQLIVSASEKMPQRLLYCSLINVDLSNYHYARHFKYLKAEKILVPLKELADLFERIVTPIFSEIQTCRNKSKKAQQARNRLLPKLMSGELEV